MMGRQRLEELRAQGRQLAEDGHREGHDLLELIAELDRLREKEWTPVRLCDALDTIAALYVSEPEGRAKGLGDTSLLELIEWTGKELRPQGDDRRKLGELRKKLRDFLDFCESMLGTRGSS